MRTIIEDTRQKKDLHEKKHAYWEEERTNLIRSALPFGDYIAAPRVAIDTKQDIHEIALNLCGAGKEKRRFASECMKAKDAGCRLIFLIEDPAYKHIDVVCVKSGYIFNGQVRPGDQLATAMYTVENRYGCRFIFCKPEDAGRIISEILL